MMGKGSVQTGERRKTLTGESLPSTLSKGNDYSRTYHGEKHRSCEKHGLSPPPEAGVNRGRRSQSYGRIS